MEEKSELGDLGFPHPDPPVPAYGRAQDWCSVNSVEGMNEVWGNKKGFSRGWEALGRPRQDQTGRADS